ncbi:MAG: L,D-transpeptidase, partial [Chloroflexi bacterium]|nr:L,D-transpeptidase [Chloroflexota bacterium]
PAMSHTSKTLSRRDFLKLAGLGLGTLAFNPFRRVLPLAEFPVSERLGRVTEPVIVRAEPKISASPITTLYEDTIVEWHREVAVSRREYMDLAHINQRWVETSEGFVYSGFLQPCRNLPNPPLTNMPEGQTGFWAEVTVPYVDLAIDNPAPVSHWARNAKHLRLYYSQVLWIDQMKTSEVTGNMLYRVNEKYGNPGDLFWALGSAFRPLTEDEIAPIHPEVDPNEKRVVINITNQTLSCQESQREVYFCRVSTGAKYDAYGNAVDAWATPVGTMQVSSKLISTRMGSSTGAGYEQPGVSWVAYFATGGVAIHSAFWHNLFGEPRSHGCVNCTPEDAKWIFRWLLPVVSLTQDRVEVQWPNPSTQVIGEERLW